MEWTRWPFADERAFWNWAMDPDAELDEQDEDLLLHDPAGLDLLVMAADRPDCPKGRCCCRILEDDAVLLLTRTDIDAVAVLRAGRAGNPREAAAHPQVARVRRSATGSRGRR